MNDAIPGSAPPSAEVLSCRSLGKIYRQGAYEVPVLLGVDLDVARGQTRSEEHTSELQSH